MNRPLLSLALLLGAPAFAQSPTGLETPTALPRRVPLHGSPHDPAYGLWAAGPTYKASFHDGFVFYPVLGDAHPENLPVRWTTTSARAGEIELITRSEASPRVDGEWRCAYDLGGVVETYDLLADGVEQSFVVREKPSAAGDLVIEGCFESKLRAQFACEGSHELHFVDANGDPIVRYGEATAIDARGATFAVATELGGACVRLRLGAEAVALASFPLVIDPLVGRFGFDMIVPVVNTDVACDNVTNGPNTMFAMEIAVSASDHDLYFALGTSDFANHGWVLQLLNISDQRNPAVAFVRGAHRWIAVYSEPTDRVYAYVHPRNNTMPNAGGAPFLVSSSGIQPDIGGSLTTPDDDALLVFRSTNLLYPMIVGRTVNAATKSLGATFEIASTTSPATIDRRHPAVNQAASSDSWVVVWEETATAQSTSIVRANKASANGTIGNDTILSFQTGAPFLHAKRPQIAGCAGRYLASYVAGSGANTENGEEIHTVRFDWHPMFTLSNVISQDVLATAAPLSSLSNPALAFDYGTLSHWCLFHRRSMLLSGSGNVYRLGYTGGVVAREAIAPGSGATHLSAGAAAFDGVLDRFAISYGTNAASAPAWIDWLEYSGSSIPYGPSCGGAISVSHRPNAGDELFRVILSQANGALAAWLLIGVDTAAIPLDGVGMVGCTLLVDPTVLVTVPAAISNGGASITIPLPDDPPIFGDVDCQWLLLQPGANAAGLTTSNGIELYVQ